MTLFRSFVAAILIVGSLAQANVITVNRSSDRGLTNDYGPVQPDPRRGDDYGPIQLYPGEHPDDRWDGGGRSRSEEIYVGRYLRNESINLLRELSHLRGSRVQSVHVYVQRSREVNSRLDLLVNGRSEDSRRADVGRVVTLSPRSLLEIGRNLRGLDVYVRGEMLIDRVVVQVATEGHRPPPYEPPYDDDRREIAVRLNLPSYLPPQAHLDLTPYIDIRSYRGYRVKAVEITAAATRGMASLDVLLNSFSEGRISLSTRQTTQTVRSRQSLVIGSSFGSLVLAPRGDSNIMEVRLILSR